MTERRDNIANKTAALVENHSILAGLLAVLCLVFAVNFFLTGPGSDGGSGLGGTGKFGGTGGTGGESGFGGTGKTPDTGPGFKLGANESDRNNQEGLYTGEQAESGTAYLAPDNSPLDALHAELGLEALNNAQIARLAVTPKPDFDIDSLRFSPDAQPVPTVLTNDMAIDVNKDLSTIDVRVANVVLKTSDQEFDTVLDVQRDVIAADALVASLDILNSLILAEAETAVSMAAVVALNDADSNAADHSIRQRISVPVRPERPDRFAMPGRIAPVQRVDVPAPPPVRPMRTLSTLLNR